MKLLLLYLLPHITTICSVVVCRYISDLCNWLETSRLSLGNAINTVHTSSSYDLCTLSGFWLVSLWLSQIGASYHHITADSTHIQVMCTAIVLYTAAGIVKRSGVDGYLLFSSVIPRNLDFTHRSLVNTRHRPYSVVLHWTAWLPILCRIGFLFVHSWDAWLDCLTVLNQKAGHSLTKLAQFGYYDKVSYY